jgi:hypothetical protein
VVEIKNNFPDFSDKLKGKELEPFAPPSPSGIRRRMISLGVGGRPRKFAGVIYGRDVASAGGRVFDSSSVSLGRDLPSPAEMVQREDVAEKKKDFLKNKDKFPLPKNPREER